MNSPITQFRAALVLFLLGLFLAGSIQAANGIRDGRAIVKPASENRYEIDGYTFGKAELFGYLSELKETKNISGIVLKDGSKSGSKATDEQRKSIASIGNTLQLETFTQQGGEMQPLVKD